MSATFYERACKFGAYVTNGGALDLNSMEVALNLFAMGKASVATVAVQAAIGPPASLTTAQLTELTTLLATKPNENAMAASMAIVLLRWPSKVMSSLRAGIARLPGYTTEAEVKSQLGV